jgi:hypothetical protein
MKVHLSGDEHSGIRVEVASMRRLGLLGWAGWVVLVLAPARALAGEPPTTPAETARQAAEQQSQATEKGLPKEQTGKDWAFGLFTGVQYDDNVILRNHYVTEGGDRTDWKWVNALFADYRIINSMERVTLVRYDGYQNFIDLHDELQLTGNTLTIRHTEIHAPVIVDLPLSYSRYDLHGTKFLELWNAAPGLFLQESPHLVGVLRGALRRFDYADRRDSPMHNPDRSSDVYEGGLEQWLLLGDRGQHRLEAGCSFRRELANRNEWSNDASEVRLAVHSALPWGRVSVDAFTTYTNRLFDTENAAFGKTERDNLNVYGLALSRPLWETKWSTGTVTASYLYTDQRSNVQSQDYHRNQVTLGLIVLF